MSTQTSFTAVVLTQLHVEKSRWKTHLPGTTPLIHIHRPLFDTRKAKNTQFISIHSVFKTGKTSCSSFQEKQAAKTIKHPSSSAVTNTNSCQPAGPFKNTQLQLKKIHTNVRLNTLSGKEMSRFFLKFALIYSHVSLDEGVCIYLEAA